MSTRRRKFCALLGVLFSVVIMTIATVSAFATPFVGLQAPYNSPPLYMDFRYHVFENESFTGDVFSIIEYRHQINSTVGNGSYSMYDGNSLDEPPSTMSGYFEWSDNKAYMDHNQNLIGGTFSWSQAFNLSDYNTEFVEFPEYYDYVQTFEYYTDIEDLNNLVDLTSVSISARDYYVFGANWGNNTLSDGTPLNVRIAIPREAYDHIYLTVAYSLQGDTEIHTLTFEDHPTTFDDDHVYFNVTGSMLEIPSTEIAYIHNAHLTLRDVVNDFDRPTYSRLLEDFFEDTTFGVDIQGTLLKQNNRNIDVQTHVQVYEFQNYTEWLASAVGGFLGTEIFGGITFGGLLAMVIGFFGVLWFLKVFAGG